jgi:hypothetical protein
MYLLAHGLNNVDIQHYVNQQWYEAIDAANRRVALTLTDVRYLRQKYNSQHQLHVDDSVAMHLLSERMSSDVLIYYASRDERTGDNPHPKFCSIIMNDTCVESLHLFGKDMAFMDTTYGVTRYGYCFTALVVKDSHSNHWPVAFMIHYEETKEVFTTFLTQIKRRAGVLPAVIVTDVSAAGKNHKRVSDMPTNC